MGITVPVLNSCYRQFGISAFTMHDQYLPPPPPAPPIPSVPGLVEGPAFMGYGYAFAKKAPTVLVDGNAGIQQGHDVGYLIPHFAVPMNALCAVHTGLSKHKVLFPVSSVTLESKPVGTYLPILFGLICANPVSLPTGVLVMTKGTVFTSATATDILKGCAYAAIDVFIDYVFKKVRGRLPKLGGPGYADKLQQWAAQHGGLMWITPDVMKKLWRPVADELPPKAQQLLDKVLNSLTKGWLVSPIVSGGTRGAPGVGRGKLSWKPHWGPVDGREKW